MGFKKNAEGNYIIYYCERHPITRVPKGLRRYRNSKKQPITSEAEAKRIENDLRREVRAMFEERANPTWQVVLREMLEFKLEAGEWSVKTADNCEVNLGSYTLPVWRNRRISSFNAHEIKELVLKQLEGKSASHQKNVLKFIRAVFAFASDKGYIVGNPCPKIKFKSGDKIKGLLTTTQIETLLNQAKLLQNEWYPIWAMACYTGMRTGELYALEWQNVDLDRRKIRVNSSWNAIDGFKSTKSGHDRWVEIAPELAIVLAELKLTSPNAQYVLPRLEHWTKGLQARELKLFLEKIGLPPIRFHDLRASWATIMLCLGIEPVKVMAMGGWRDLKTMQIYIRQSGIDTKGIVDGLSLHDASRNGATVLRIDGRNAK